MKEKITFIVKFLFFVFMFHAARVQRVAQSFFVSSGCAGKGVSSLAGCAG